MKPKISPHTSPRTVPTVEEISRRAYEIWQARGCPQGTDLQDWLEAERQLCECGTYEDAHDPAITETNRNERGARDASFGGTFEDAAKLATKVEKQVKTTALRPESRTSKTSLDL